MWLLYWLVDLLDGIKEFIKKNGEFMVNIVFIENGKLIMGVVYVLVLNKSYVGIVGEGVWIEVNGEFIVIFVCKYDGVEVWKVVGSCFY